MNENILSGRNPVKLCSNRVGRTYLGGMLIDKWKSIQHAKDSYFPEEWVASVVTSRNPMREHIENEGLSETEIEYGRRVSLKHLIELNPETFLGKKHIDKYGQNTGVLVKVLDSQERLSIQVHPDRETAERIFNSQYGKTEAWYIIGGRNINGEPPHIYFGFKPGITKEKWEKMFWEQDIDGMLNSMHKFYVKPGQVFLIEGGIPHAIGAGCFLIEIQEPTDYTIRVERTTPAGLELPDYLCHQGAGFEKMFECFKFDAYTEENIKSRWYREARKLRESDGGSESKLIGYEDTPYFSMNLIKVNGEFSIQDSNTFSILVVTEGNGFLMWEDGKMELKQGDQVFLPEQAKNLSFAADEYSQLSLVRCFPPA